MNFLKLIVYSCLVHMEGGGEGKADYVRSNAPVGISFQRVYAKPRTREDDDDDSGKHLT